VATVFSGLEPAVVWRHFATLCSIPRASREEGPLREHLRSWASGRGLAARIDPAGNLIVAKPASAGREGAPGVVLQAHLDMVCQKNTGSAHDFSRDPIVPVLREGWLVAESTTLGADNGIGAAMILAALECADLRHGPIEALFTVDEEMGMGGALGLAADELSGRLLVNLDTEEWGEFVLGCAGGLDVNVCRGGAKAKDGAGAPLPPGHRSLRLAVRGLQGGHSGMDIHLGRGNAIKLLVRVLRALEEEMPLRLAGLRGGTARNALAREAFAEIAVPSADCEALPGFLARWQELLRGELAGADEGVALSLEPGAAGPVMPAAEQQAWLASLHAAPHGVRRMSRRVPGVVETSNNLGVVELGPGAGSCNFMVRSLLDSGSADLAAEIASLFSLSGSKVEMSGHYPGWTPNPDSPLLAKCRAVFRRDFGLDSTVQVLHAGLECGIIGARYPGMDAVSFGPTIRGAHAPGERVEVASVEKAWRLLAGILEECSSAQSAG
jgi:dipeptidase D